MNEVSVRGLVAAVVFVLLALYGWHCVGEWEARGCGARSWSLALHLGAPEWDQYCTRGHG